MAHFKTDIESFFNEENMIGVYTQQIIAERFIHLSSGLAKYYLNQGMHGEGYTFLLKCLEKCTSTNYKSYIIKCVKLYEVHQEYATPETKAAYRKLINEVDESEE